MAIAKVGRRGQVTLPRSVRRRLNIEEGDSIAFVERENEVVLQPLSLTLLDLRGSVHVDGPQDFDSLRRRMEEESGRQAAQREDD